MTDYKKYINALRKCAKEHENDKTFTGHIIVVDLCRETANLLESLEQGSKTGHWITRPHVYGVTYCSECGFELRIDNTKYCPNCGIKMVEPQESEET